MRMELVIRFDYGSIVPWVRQDGRGISAIAGPDMLHLRTDVELKGVDLRTVAEFTVSEGQRVPFDLTWHPSHRPDPQPLDAEEALRETDHWWREWSDRCTAPPGEWCEAIKRSLITLKALTYAPTGGIVAAPTTSLPEHIGGVRNWDYRYCWVRDATFTLYSLLNAGYHDEALPGAKWRPRRGGQPGADEHHVRPRRRAPADGAGARLAPRLRGLAPGPDRQRRLDQHQLDIYGEVMDMLHQCRKAGLVDDGWRVERALLGLLESIWREPDEGIWEVRGPRRHFTHSKMMAWVAFDRAVKAVEQYGLDGPVDRWRALRDAVHEQVCREGFDAEVGAFVQSYGSKGLDASLLMMPLVGFLPANDPRVLGTVAAIERGLMTDGFVARYVPEPGVDGLPPGEGTFLPCTFWLADNYALQGRHDEARRVFERLLAIRNDVGLLSEEYDPAAGRLVGNFPQAFSHIGLVNTAYNLASAPEGPAHASPRS